MTERAGTTGPAELFPAASAKPVSVGAALESLKDDSPDPPVLNETSEVAKLMRFCKPGTSLAQSVTKGKYFNWIRAAFGKPCPTVPSSTTWAGYSIWHPSEDRSFSGREFARLQSFPDGFKFGGDHKEWVAQIGNSVPPMMMRAVAGALAERLFRRKMDELRLEDHESYAALLGAAWELHLAPRAPGAPTVVSLFAGCGGSSLGYSMAGYRELLAVDWNEKCAATFRLNFPGVPFLVENVRELTAERLMGEAGLAAPGVLDVLDGSPPCQGFSTAGKRDLWDPRNELYREFARLLEGTRPRAFVMENVSGMVKGKMKLAFADCTRALKAAGYRVSCRLLDAKWFLVPQERKRLIWVGVRGDLAAGPSHPAAQARPVSVTEALADLLPGIAGQAADGPAPTVTANTPPVALLDDGRRRGWTTDRPSFTVGAGRRPELHSPSVLAQWEAKKRYVGSYQSVRLEKGEPSPMQIGAHRNWHPTEARQLDDRECARLQSFPDAFAFRGNKAEVQRQIGNGVPPLLMRVVAAHVAGLIGASAS